jgi:NADH-quinone oxidoreductase subunit A
MNPTSIVAYLTLFAVVGFLFLFVTLLLGRLFRAQAPSSEKLRAYECGEPSIGSSFVQFDLRFYVVALVFIVFDVEVAFFFPWATVFGKATQLTDPDMAVVAASAEAAGDEAAEETIAAGDRRAAARPEAVLTAPASQRLRELGVAEPTLPQPGGTVEENARRIRAVASRLALTALADIAVFFCVLLVAFAYVWSRGDLDWVRATEPAGRRAAAARGP